MIELIHHQYLLFTAWLHLHPHFAGIATFLIAFSESVAVVGSIVPGSVLMTAIGILIGSGVIDIWTTLGFATLGALLGDASSYFLGFYLKEGVTTIWPFNRYPKLLQSGRNFFKKHGGKSIFIGRFAGPIRAMVPLISGMLHFPKKRYFLASIPAAILWSPIYMMPGILLGAASLEMPPDMATALILVVMIALVVFWIVVKSIVYLYDKTHLYFASLLDRHWTSWKKSSATRWLCLLLHHAERPEKRGQLLLAINTLIAFLFFCFLLLNVIYKTHLLDINLPIYHLFRGLRTPLLDKIAVIIGIFSYKYVLLTLVILLTGYFIIKKYYVTALHWLGGCGASAAIAYVSKYLFYYPRPTGIASQELTGSFPSGHVTFAIMVYGFLVFLLTRSIASKKIRLTLYWLTCFWAILIGVARLYLGAHWFTDILGGTLLALCCLGVTVISYQRHRFKKLPTLTILWLSLLILTVMSTYRIYSHYQKDIQDSQIVRPIYSMSLQGWRNQTAPHIPYFRTNRLGQPVKILDIQWIGDLKNIQFTLRENNWYGLHSKSYKTILKEIAQEKGAKNYHYFFDNLYNDQHPTLTLIKFINKQSPPLILRLWPANIRIILGNKPLWVGTLYYDISEKHLFFFRHKIKTMKSQQAINALMPALKDKYIWRIKVVNPTNLPKKLLKQHLINKIMLIEPIK